MKRLSNFIILAITLCSFVACEKEYDSPEELDNATLISGFYDPGVGSYYIQRGEKKAIPSGWLFEIDANGDGGVLISSECTNMNYFWVSGETIAENAVITYNGLILTATYTFDVEGYHFEIVVQSKGAYSTKHTASIKVSGYNSDDDFEFVFNGTRDPYYDN